MGFLVFWPEHDTDPPPPPKNRSRQLRRAVDWIIGVLVLSGILGALAALGEHHGFLD